jgi:hypothetical protein
MTFDGALGLCPLNSREVEVNRVLDVGTGTGIWAMDYGAFPWSPRSDSIYANVRTLADDHPEAHVRSMEHTSAAWDLRVTGNWSWSQPYPTLLAKAPPVPHHYNLYWHIAKRTPQCILRDRWPRRTMDLLPKIRLYPRPNNARNF